MLLAKVMYSIALGVGAIVSVAYNRPIVAGACVLIWAVVMGQSKED